MFKKRTLSVRGQGLVEYGLILVLVAVVIIVIVALLGKSSTPKSVSLLTDDYVKQIFASEFGVNPQDVEIRYRLNDGTKNYVFKVFTPGKLGVVWCEVLNDTEVSCNPFEDRPTS